ncbi:alanine:cation symporter family protein [Oceanispirochaeta sp. M2]|nr:alanine:cation symporter family protein [Oceanispirochaeta sp. M2]NPD74075.1 alanine:cation symporter family protein [Oceanispirochaeta sp. M1]RDG30142.1 alanine:cation symporter family protein [Oceanispirochaeta sp. M1]
MIIFLVGTGILLSVGTRFVQFRKLGKAFRLLFSKDHAGTGDITPFQALMTSLSATIGTGNIAGVATAIALGGPGAVFWMWMTAAFGGATKFGEAVLAIKYRETNDKGEQSGGPMYYIKNGMKDKFGGNWGWLGWLFAFFGVFASFGIGSMVQSNSVAAALNTGFDIPPLWTGIILTVLTALVIVGGIKSIAKVTSKIVPLMALFFVAGSLAVLVGQASRIPAAFSMIFSNAFNSSAVTGGLVGTVIRLGVARGVFSNEAGLGSAPIAHAASSNNNPYTQGLIASLGSFIDTLIICTMTALVILVSGLVSIGADGMMTVVDGLNGAALTTRAFDASLPGIGKYLVSLGLIFFAFSTILGWYYYGSKCLEYIAGTKSIVVYKVLFLASALVGTVLKIGIVWDLSDTFNGLMALPNLIALIALSTIIFQTANDAKEDVMSGSTGQPVSVL